MNERGTGKMVNKRQNSESVLNVNINNVHSYRSSINIERCGKSAQSFGDFE